MSANPRAVPSPRLRGELHHARMTLLPIIAEGGNTWVVAMLAVEAMYRVELMARGQKIEAKRWSSGNGAGVSTTVETVQTPQTGSD